RRHLSAEGLLEELLSRCNPRVVDHLVRPLPACGEHHRGGRQSSTGWLCTTPKGAPIRGSATSGITPASFPLSTMYDLPSASSHRVPGWCVSTHPSLMVT